MQVITLTSDMGTEDFYVASLKGAIFSTIPSVQVVDVSHQVIPFDVSHACYQLKSCFQDFPLGSIHIMAVDSEPIINFGSPQHGAMPSVMLFKGHYFVSNDNGFFSLLTEGERFEKFWNLDDVLSNPNAFRFPAKNILIPAACKIAQGVEISSFASEADGFKKMFNINAVIEKNLIKGQITHIDHYGNAITNITKELFYRFGEETPFTLFFRKKEYYIDEISGTYNEVPPGEKLAFFNSNDLLEIAINRGAKARNNGADTMFGIHLGDTVRIEFTPRGSKETLESLF
jgi:S-adenosylmethionine hydrolase